MKLDSFSPMRRGILVLPLLFLLTERADGEAGQNGLFARFDLAESCAGWLAGFADYPAGQELFYELTAECANGETNLNRGIFLSGANHSDDLFMFIKHPVGGLTPSCLYQLEARVVILSKAPTGCIGAGGDPGASVYVKFGASTEEPAPVLQTNGWLRMNVDKGNQSLGGTNAEVIGDIATGITNCFNTQYVLKELETPSPFITQSDSNGTLWIFAGTDSGFEGRTSLFFTQLEVHLRPASSDSVEHSTNHGDVLDCDVIQQ